MLFISLKNKRTKPTVILKRQYGNTFFPLTSSNYCLVTHRVKQVFKVFQNEGSILFPLKSDYNTSSDINMNSTSSSGEKSFGVPQDSYVSQ